MELRPYLKLDGEYVSCRTNRLGIDPIAMSGASVEWGRESYFGQTEPARLHFRLLDSTGVWSVKIRDRKALGTHVEFLTDLPDGRTIPIFRGTVAAATCTRSRRKDVWDRPVWEISLICVDPTAALSTIIPLPGVLSEQDTMEQRKQWLLGLSKYGGMTIADIDYESGYAKSQCHPLEVGQDSAYDLLSAFYESMSGETFTYDVDTNTIRQCQRMDILASPYLVSQSDTPGAVLIASNDLDIDGTMRPGIGLSSCEVIVDEITLEVTSDTDYNSVETNWKDYLREWDDGKTTRESVPLGSPRRLLSNDTWMWHATHIDNQLDSMWDRTQLEGRLPRHPELKLKPGFSFPTERVARWLLRCWEDTRPAFINGDLLHEWLNGRSIEFPPIVSPLGGKVTFNADTGWDISLHVQWVYNRRQYPSMSWKNLQQIKTTTSTPNAPWWWSLIGKRPKPVTVGSPTPEYDVYWGPVNVDSAQYRFDKSVTWADLQYLDSNNSQIREILA